VIVGDGSRERLQRRRPAASHRPGAGERHGDHGAKPTARAATKVDPREPQEERPPILWLGGSLGSSDAEEKSRALAQVGADASGSEETEVTDLDETCREDVKEKATDELLGHESHGLSVLGREAHRGVADGEEAMVGEADAVGVAAEVAEDLLGTSERALGVDDPVLSVEVILEPGEGTRIPELGQGTGEVEVPAGVLARQGGEEFSAEFSWPGPATREAA
jgi:hypothetical protein